jgi:hypothetical protein
MTSRLDVSRIRDSLVIGFCSHQRLGHGLGQRYRRAGCLPGRTGWSNTGGQDAAFEAQGLRSRLRSAQELRVQRWKATGPRAHTASRAADLA